MDSVPNSTQGQQWLRKLKTAAYANIALWGISMIALVFILEKSSSPKGLYVIFVVGVVIGIQIITLANKQR